MSSWVRPRSSLKRRTRVPNASKNEVGLITHIYLVSHEQKHHEQNSWTVKLTDATLTRSSPSGSVDFEDGLIGHNWTPRDD